MKRLIPLTALASAIFALLCFAAISVGKGQPTPTTPGLDLCDGMPCYMGIVLNHTPEEEAKRALSKFPGAIILEGHYFAKPATGYFQSIDVLSRDSLVIEIVLDHTDSGIHDDTLSAGLVLSALGAPCAVHSGLPNRPQLVILSYPGKVLYIATDGGHLYPNSLVSEVDLGPYDPSQHLCSALGNETALPRYTWRGFRHYPTIKTQ